MAMSKFIQKPYHEKLISHSLIVNFQLIEIQFRKKIKRIDVDNPFLTNFQEWRDSLCIYIGKFCSKKIENITND